MFDMTVVDLSRLQFALTAMYHFLFVPLTLGLAVILAIMETVYVMTGREIWKRMVKFWGVLFGINFAMGVATGITMEFQFGTNWAYYSHYVGDVFGAPLAIEGLMAFFLEATFIGLFFFGWDKMSKVAHLGVTYMVALGSNLSALWILVANGWMQNPVGSVFNPETMRMEVTDFAAVIFNPVAQAKFVHTVSAGYVTGAVFVLAVSAFYLLRNRHTALAKRSFAVAASFGLLASLSVVVLGDESGYALTDNQKMKLAALEAMWETEEAPADLSIIGIPNAETGENAFEIKIPYVLGLIATRSFDEEIPGINQLVSEAEQRIQTGLLAYGALQKMKTGDATEEERELFVEHREDLGYAALLQRYIENPLDATNGQIRQAAFDTVPNVFVMYWSFRVMAGLGFFFIAMFGIAFWLSATQRFQSNRWFLRAALYSLPLPWVAAQLGWLLAEYGRQPWIIEGVLPTFAGVSSIGLAEILTTIAGFVILYSTLAVVDVYLMAKVVKEGPGAGGKIKEALTRDMVNAMGVTRPQPAE